jgi:hypothetical protein
VPLEHGQYGFANLVDRVSHTPFELKFNRVLHRVISSGRNPWSSGLSGHSAEIRSIRQQPSSWWPAMALCASFVDASDRTTWLIGCVRCECVSAMARRGSSRTP